MRTTIYPAPQTFPARSRIQLSILAMLAALAAPAAATNYAWLTGNYPGPNPLLFGDTVTATTLADKNFNTIAFTNNGGLIWATAARMGFLTSTFLNNGLVDMQDDASLQHVGGSGSTFTNSNMFRKSAGTGVTEIKSNIFFSNSGTIDAQTGTIDFTGGSATFHGGSLFTGAGVNRISGNATFNDAFTSTNLLLATGNYTGNNAIINGAVQWNGGQFVGAWQLPSGQTLNAGAGLDKNFNVAAFTNDATVNWQSANRIGFLTSTFTNNNLFNIQDDANLQHIGGSASTFTNNGSATFRKSGGAGVTAVISNVHFVNHGTIDAQTGTIQFTGGSATFHGGSLFTGAGVNRISSNATFNDAFTSSNLLLATGNYTGNNAIINGAVQWNGGQFLGAWQLPSGQTLNAGAGLDKNFNSVAFTNDATVNWQSANRIGFLTSTFTNNNLFNIQDDANLQHIGGSASTFTNNGSATFRKSGGAGVTAVMSNVHFVNHGTIDAQTGTIDFSGGSATFNGGSLFTGAGVNRISSNATFNGAFTSSNLLLATGNFTGNAAMLNGDVAWDGGQLLGSWTVNPGQTLVANSTVDKNFTSSNFTNKGTISWLTDDRIGFATATVSNQGLIDIQQDANLTHIGGSASTLQNLGVFRKSGGSGTTVIGANVNFTNPGTIEAMSGTIQLPNNFSNAGTITGTAGVKTNVLTNVGTIAPGASPGTLTLDGDLVLTGTSNLDIELGGLAGHDTFAVTGTALLDGMLTVRHFGAYAPQVGDSFTFLTYASRVGLSEFDSVAPIGWGGGVAFSVAYNAGHAQISVTAVPEPGTYAMLLVGLGMVGGIAWRRRTA